MPIVALGRPYPRFFSSTVLECHRQGECVSILSVLFLKHNVLYRSLDLAMSPTLFEFEVQTEAPAINQY